MADLLETAQWNLCICTIDACTILPFDSCSALTIEGIKSYACKKYSLQGWKDFRGYSDRKLFSHWSIAEIAVSFQPPRRRRRRRMVFGFVPLQEKQGAVQTLIMCACVHHYFIWHRQCVVILSNDIYCAKHECCHICEQFVQDFVESHPICERCARRFFQKRRGL